MRVDRLVVADRPAGKDVDDAGLSERLAVAGSRGESAPGQNAAEPRIRAYRRSEQTALHPREHPFGRRRHVRMQVLGFRRLRVFDSFRAGVLAPSGVSTQRKDGNDREDCGPVSNHRDLSKTSRRMCVESRLGVYREPDWGRMHFIPIPNWYPARQPLGRPLLRRLWLVPHP
jgi:hypothetical protein